jgi:hypothetical protein
MSDLKEELSQKAEQVSGAVTKLNTGMTIAEMIKVLGPEIKTCSTLCYDTGKIYPYRTVRT